MNGLEITTGGQRIHQHALLVESMVGRGLNPESFGHYLERLTAGLLGLSNVREATAFPRDRTRLTP